MNSSFPLGITRNPITQSVFGVSDNLKIAPGQALLVITDDELSVKTDDGQYLTTD